MVSQPKFQHYAAGDTLHRIRIRCLSTDRKLLMVEAQHNQCGGDFRESEVYDITSLVKGTQHRFE